MVPATVLSPEQRNKRLANLVITIFGSMIAISLFVYAFWQYESTDRLLMFYVPAFLFLWILDEWRKGRIPVIGSKWGIWVVVVSFLILMVAGGFYFFQYATLLY
ncbi:MAG: hypothetical protein Q7R57_01310, partial [Dehalococcoidales bacterium]|nr:hypothetical protein [Dehalococcoidales bacterium]